MLTFCAFLSSRSSVPKLFQEDGRVTLLSTGFDPILQSKLHSFFATPIQQDARNIPKILVNIDMMAYSCCTKITLAPLFRNQPESLKQYRMDLCFHHCL